MRNPLGYRQPLLMLDGYDIREQHAIRSLSENSPLEGPVTGFNRHFKLMSPATRELVLQSRSTEIEAFAADRGLNPAMVAAVADAAMRMGRVPDVQQYGFDGDDALAVKHFIAGDVLNNYTEDDDAEAEAALLATRNSKLAAIEAVEKAEGWENLAEMKMGSGVKKEFVFSTKEKAQAFIDTLKSENRRFKEKPKVKKTKGWKTFSAIVHFYALGDTVGLKYTSEKPSYRDIMRDLKEDEALTESAQTTWKQLKQMKLNGFPLLAYLGAKSPSVDKDQLTVTLRGKWKGRVIIKINQGTDLYDLTFGRVRKYEWIVDAKVLGVEVGNLAHVLQRYVEYGEATGKKGKVISADVSRRESALAESETVRRATTTYPNYKAMRKAIGHIREPAFEKKNKDGSYTVYFGKEAEKLHAAKRKAAKSEDVDVVDEAVNFKRAAKVLLKKSTDAKQPLGYTAYLRAVIQGNSDQATHLRSTKTYMADASQAMQDLIDMAGKAKYESVQSYGEFLSEAVLKSAPAGVPNGALIVHWDGNTGKSLYVYHVQGGRLEKVAQSAVLKRERSIFGMPGYDNATPAKDFTWKKLVASSGLLPGFVHGYLAEIGKSKLRGAPVYIVDQHGKVIRQLGSQAEDAQITVSYGEFLREGSAGKKRLRRVVKANVKKANTGKMSDTEFEKFAGEFNPKVVSKNKQRKARLSADVLGRYGEFLSEAEKSAWDHLKPQYRSEHSGWSKHGEFFCPYCDTSIGKNLRGMKPFAAATAHLKTHGKTPADMAKLSEAIYNITATPAASKTGSDAHKLAQEIERAIAPLLKGRYLMVRAQDVFGQAQSIHIRSGNITPAMRTHNTAWHNDDYKFQVIVSGFLKDGSAGPKITAEQITGSYKTKSMRKKSVKPGKENQLVNHIKKYVADLMKDAPAPRAEEVQSHGERWDGEHWTESEDWFDGQLLGSLTEEDDDDEEDDEPGNVSMKYTGGKYIYTGPSLLVIVKTDRGSASPNQVRAKQIAGTRVIYASDGAEDANFFAYVLAGMSEEDAKKLAVQVKRGVDWLKASHKLGATGTRSTVWNTPLYKTFKRTFYKKAKHEDIEGLAEGEPKVNDVLAVASTLQRQWASGKPSSAQAKKEIAKRLKVKPDHNAVTAVMAVILDPKMASKFRKLGESLLEAVLGEVSPPGFSGTVEKMKDHMTDKEAFQRAWAMYKKGAQPHYEPKDDAKGMKNYISPAKYEKYMAKKRKEA